jgi:hypothetical protein
MKFSSVNRCLQGIYPQPNPQWCGVDHACPLGD